MNAQNLALALIQVPADCERVLFVRTGKVWKAQPLERPAQPKRDAFADFVADQCEIRKPSADLRDGSSFECRAEDFRQALKLYCERIGHLEKISAKRIGSQLQKLGIATRKSVGLTVYRGIRLRQVECLTARASRENSQG